MTHTYKISGMTCGGCQAKVKHLLSVVEGVKNIEVSLQTSKAAIEMSQHIPTSKLKAALAAFPHYQIWEKGSRLPGFWEDMYVWKKAGKNTLNCLIGCSIGDFAMITYLQSGYHHINMFLMMAMAMIAGLATSIILETVLLKINEKFNWTIALKTAFGMSFLSMLAMEIAENATDLFLTKGQAIPSEPFYWIALSISLLAGFIVPLPYNYFKLKKYGIACH